MISQKAHILLRDAIQLDALVFMGFGSIHNSVALLHISHRGIALNTLGLSDLELYVGSGLFGQPRETPYGCSIPLDQFRGRLIFIL